jgi:hypothetical protein
VTPLPGREPAEPLTWFERFTAYVLLGTRRSVLGAYNAEKAREGPRKPAASAPRSWKSAASAWRWRERAGAWDAAKLERRRVADAAAFRDELDRHRRHAVEIARALVSIDVDGLKVMGEKLSRLKAEDVTVSAIPGFLRALAAVGDAALNAEAAYLGCVEILKALDPPDWRTEPPTTPRPAPWPPTPPADRDPPAGPPAADGLAAAEAALFDGP